MPLFYSKVGSSAIKFRHFKGNFLLVFDHSSTKLQINIEMQRITTVHLSFGFILLPVDAALRLFILHVSNINASCCFWFTATQCI